MQKDVRRLKRSLLVGFGCVAFLAGVGVSVRWQFGAAWWAVGLAVPVVLRKRQDVITVLCVTLCCFGVGWGRGSHVAEQFAAYRQLAMHKVVIVGRVADDVVYGSRSQLTFPIDHVQLYSPSRHALPGQISVAGFGLQSGQRGDVVRVSGKLYPTRGSNSASISFANMTILSRGSSPIDALRRRFAAGLESALPEPQASFGLGLLIGQRNTLSADTAQILLAVGLTHLVAVSGYNVTIMIDAVRRLLAGRSKFQTAAGCLSLVFVFVLITGSSPSIVRASIISTLSILLWYCGRTLKPLTLLLLAAAVTAAASPQYVWGNVSWYLSFLAFFGVLVLAPLVMRRLFGDNKPRLVVRIMVESLCAEAMTIPYMLHIFGQLSFAGLPANVLVAACVPLAMLLCLVAGLGGLLLPVCAGWLAWPARLLLGYMLDTAGALSRVPHVFVDGLHFSLVQMYAAYATVMLCWFILQQKSKKDAIITDKNSVAGKKEQYERTF